MVHVRRALSILRYQQLVTIPLRFVCNCSVQTVIENTRTTSANNNNNTLQNKLSIRSCDLHHCSALNVCISKIVKTTLSCTRMLAAGSHHHHFNCSLFFFLFLLWSKSFCFFFFQFRFAFISVVMHFLGQETHIRLLAVFVLPDTAVP